MSPDDTADKDLANEETDAERLRLEMDEMRQEIEPAVRRGIARMVAVLKEAGGSLPTRVVRGRLQEDDSTTDWADMYRTALEEGVVWSPDDGMLCLPQKRGPGMSPEAQAMRRAFEKAKGLGVIRHTGERFVLTGFPDNGLLAPAELEGAERWMNRCNAMGRPEVRNMYALCREGKVTREELRAYTRGVAAQADRQSLVHAQKAARKKADTA